MVRLKQFSLGDRGSEEGFEQQSSGTESWQPLGHGAGHQGSLAGCTRQPEEQQHRDSLPWFRVQNMQQMLPSPTGRDLDVHQGGLVWCQATFLKVSKGVWKVPEKCSACLGLLDLASSAVSQREIQSHAGRTKEHQMWLFHSSLFLPNQQNPWLYGQRHLHSQHRQPSHRLAQMITFCTPETERVQSHSPLGKLPLNTSFSWLEIFSFLSVLIHGPHRPISSCANALI